MLNLQFSVLIQSGYLMSNAGFKFIVSDKTVFRRCFSRCSNKLLSVFGNMQNSRKPFRVSVEGNIGSGKTCFLKHLSHDPNFEVLMEPIDKWTNLQGSNPLALMYSDPRRWALTFQTWVQLTMLQGHQAPCAAPVKLMERSLHSAKYIFVENLRRKNVMPEFEYVVLTKWFEFLLKQMSEDLHVDLIVYLRTAPEKCLERIATRGRQEEKPIPLEYLCDIHELYEEWLIHKSSYSIPAPVLVIDSNGSKEHTIELFDEHKKQILNLNQ